MFWEVEICVKNIVNYVRKLFKKYIINKILSDIVISFNWGMSGFEGDVFYVGSEYRNLFEKIVGLGLGVFDLVVIDEVYKSRGEISSFNMILNNIVLKVEEVCNFVMIVIFVELGVG